MGWKACFRGGVPAAVATRQAERATRGFPVVLPLGEPCRSGRLQTISHSRTVQNSRYGPDALAVSEGIL
jgi:hypothetical protein